eukprot:CAMPEP_0172561382 /NCGR_PEP_ID=MMETSP1067-20121228/92716_1 /TAXON_ID=265564 ORGANISM="Thalassiosira punctigera, Strain Tpunct2005C2" /NCGR_SAMPLE_ID=MMETSP1067 /ASSEMBLY_ACC=CAM_ASM_000444 /LENGTH=80 /DNA_ID=CAMNT_0013351411 /DNA_START=241 /DNA_END=479 /DNA_ORIENTATION=-
MRWGLAWTVTPTESGASVMAARYRTGDSFREEGREQAAASPTILALRAGEAGGGCSPAGLNSPAAKGDDPNSPPEPEEAS